MMTLVHVITHKPFSHLYRVFQKFTFPISFFWGEKTTISECVQTFGLDLRYWMILELEISYSQFHFTLNRFFWIPNRHRAGTVNAASHKNFNGSWKFKKKWNFSQFEVCFRLVYVTFYCIRYCSIKQTHLQFLILHR